MAVWITKCVTKSCPSRALMLFTTTQLQTCATLAVEAAFCCVPTSHSINKSVVVSLPLLPLLHIAGTFPAPLTGVRNGLRSDTRAGNKQMLPGELDLLVLERALNLLCWFAFHFTPCNSG